jgi:Leucine-rich repeat (LRR) protein
MNISIENQLDHISGNVVRLKRLKILRLAHNKLSDLPIGELMQLEDLEELDISGNPIPSESIPDKLKGKLKVFKQ